MADDDESRQRYIDKGKAKMEGSSSYPGDDTQDDDQVKNLDPVPPVIVAADAAVDDADAAADDANAAVDDADAAADVADVAAADDVDGGEEQQEEEAEAANEGVFVDIGKYKEEDYEGVFDDLDAEGTSSDIPIKKLRLSEEYGIHKDNDKPVPPLYDDQNQPLVNYPLPTNPAKPGSRVPPLDALRLTKTLSANDVTRDNGRLQLDSSETSDLLNIPTLVDEPPSPDFERLLLAYDERDVEFRLQLSVFVVNESPIYYVGNAWSLFVQVHELRAGDDVVFFRVLDVAVSNDYYYILRYIKKPRVSPPLMMDQGESSEPKHDLK